ncbi:MAG: glycosyltransferase family 25 protein [Deltaproteobacteria bacterium]|nr:glycosyltransferase family 25 protein [Deltaproteobacteria bacterium]
MSDSLSRHWEYFDKIFCISVDDRIDRQKQAKAQFDRVGLSSLVEFLFVKRHPEDCEQGIYESHLLCIKKALDAGADTILIFEDDIIFDRFTPEILETCVGFLSSDTEWKLFFMGCLVKKSRKTGIRSIRKIKYRSLTHAYVLNKKSAKQILGKKWGGIAYDAMLRTVNGGIYALYPSFAFQSNSPTDNRNYPGLDRFRKFCGGLEHIQKMNELYHRHRICVISAHIFIFLLILFRAMGLY